MSDNPPCRPTRRSPRKPGYDYARPGAYFVTLCTHERLHLFGDILDGRIALSPIGRVVDHDWRRLPGYFDEIVLDEWILMPNHLHGLVWIRPTPTGGADETQAAVAADHAQSAAPERLSIPLSTVIGTFKSLVTRRVHRMSKGAHDAVWQGRYYDHIVRNERALFEIRRDIVDNPQRWSLDTYNRAASARDPRSKAI